MSNILQSITHDYKYDSKTLLLTFGGISGCIGIPVFEFNKITDAFKIKKLFIRDLGQAWYQGGLPGVGENIYLIANFIKTQINAQGCEKVIVVGNSAGGYAALLFGNILHATKVIAFSPQTFLNMKERLLHFDLRWNEQILAMYKMPCLEESTLDLKKIFKKNPNITKFEIFYSKKDRLDTVHAKRMGNFSNIRLHEFENGGHTLVKWLRDEKILHEILSSAIN